MTRTLWTGAGARRALCLLALLGATALPALAVTPEEAAAIAWDFTKLTWVSPVTYDPPQNDGLVFHAGSTYTGEAYWFGGNDSIPSFVDKMKHGGYVPRKTAGIDCSAFVSRCWKTSRHTTATIPGIAAKVSWDHLVMGDCFNIESSHVMLYHYRMSSGAYVVWEAAGSANLVVHRSHPASYIWTYTPRRYGGMSSGGAGPAPSPAPAPAPPPPSSGASPVDAALLVTAGTLNVRSGPSTGHAVIGAVHSGQKYVAMAKDGDWYKIWFAGSTGWCYAAYVSKLDGVPVATVTADSLNVRTGPGTSHAVFGSVKKDQKYVPVMHTSGWYLIAYDGHTGWVYGDYVSIGAP